MRNANPRRIRKSRAGFALVVTLTMIVMLVVIALGLLSLSTISLKTSSESDAVATARANARMAMIVAIGKLQQEAGVDRAVTATASVLDKNIANPHWTGVWKEDKPPAWLVSSPEHADPETAVLGQSAVLQTLPDGTVTVRAPYVDVSGSSRFAWWVGDEGVKTRVDTAPAATTPKTPTERLTRASSAQSPGLTHASDEWKNLPLETDRKLLVSLSTAALAASEPDLPRDLFHDFTTGGYGLPVNVKDGGMKADLSTIFDETDPDQQSTAVQSYCGSIPAPVTVAGTPMLGFSAPSGAEAKDGFALPIPSPLVARNPLGRTGALSTTKRSNTNISSAAVPSSAEPIQRSASPPISATTTGLLMPRKVSTPAENPSTFPPAYAR